MICPGCGREVKDGIKFCSYCGAQIQKMNAASSGGSYTPPPVVKSGSVSGGSFPPPPVDPSSVSHGSFPPPPVDPNSVSGSSFSGSGFSGSGFSNGSFGGNNTYNGMDAGSPAPAKKGLSKKALVWIIIGGVLTAAMIAAIIITMVAYMGADEDTATEAAVTTTTQRETEATTTAAETTEEVTTEEPTPEETTTEEPTTEETTEATTEETTTTEEETESSLDSQMVGFWVGEQASEITMREDYSCFYQEPQNMGNERVRNGVECEWRIIGNRLMIVGAADYVIYADLDRYGDNTTITVLSDSSSWTTEAFTKQ